jgi:hypothetical protein
MTPLTKREYLRELVAGKNRWFRTLTAQERALGFLGGMSAGTCLIVITQSWCNSSPFGSRTPCLLAAAENGSICWPLKTCAKSASNWKNTWTAGMGRVTSVTRASPG